MKPLAFIGTRSGADGLFQAAEELGRPIAGWFDQYYAGRTELHAGYPILGSELDITEEDCDRYDFFLASSYSGHPVLDNPEHNGMMLRQKRIQLIRDRGLPLANLISPGAYVHPTVHIGQGVYVAHGANIRAHCVLGDFSYFCYGSTLGHHVTTQTNVIVLSETVISGDVLVEENVMIGLNCTIANGYYGKTLTLGRNSKIAAGAVVYKDVPTEQFVSVEGRRMRRLDQEM